MKLDVEALTKAILLCFENSTDPVFTDKQQNAFLFRGKILRGHLINLISAQWAANAAVELAEANSKLAVVNDELEKANGQINNFANTVQKIADLSKNLESLLALATGFA